MLTDMPILYSFRRCPYAMRARMAIATSNTQVTLREIVLRNKPNEMIAVSPKATVPVLVDGETIKHQSLDVMHWALGQNDPEGWLVDFTKNQELITENDGSFKHHLDRYKYATRYDDVDPVEHRSAGLAFLQNLETRLDKAPYLAGESRGFADIAIFPFVRQFRIPDMEWFDAAPTPNVQSWLKGLVGSPLFTSVMKKYPTWKESGKEFLFPEAITRSAR